MTISINTLVEDIQEFENNLSSKFSMLWDTLLDDDNGISEEAYDRLVILGNIIDPIFVASVSRYVDATDGRFYVRSNS